MPDVPKYSHYVPWVQLCRKFSAGDRLERIRMTSPFLLYLYFLLLIFFPLFAGMEGMDPFASDGEDLMEGPPTARPTSPAGASAAGSRSTTAAPLTSPPSPPAPLPAQ